ncbi:MAG: HAD family hydrolase [Desulforhopalus sp.]
MRVLQDDYGAEKLKGLFVVDLDGTLLTSERKFAPTDLEALCRLRTRGYLVAIATGRSNHSFELLIENLGYAGSESSLPVDFVIFSTGAGILDFPTNSLLKSFSLGSEDVLFAAEYLERAGLDYMIHKPVPDTRYFLYSCNGGKNPDFHRRLQMYGEFGSPLSRQLLENFGEATEVLCISPGNSGHRVANDIACILPQCNVIKATSPLDGTSVWIEIFPPTVSKSQAVRWLSAATGLEQRNICAVGNDYNDEDLLSWAGQSFLVENGPSSMKSDFEIVASNDNGGVAEAVTRWLAVL